MIKANWKIDGVIGDQFEPEDVENIGVLATFENMSVQPNLTITDIVMRQEGSKHIDDYVKAGISGGMGIFEAQTFQIELQDFGGQNNYIAFNGLIDLVQNYIREPDHSTIKIKDVFGLAQLENRASVVSFAFLADKNYTGAGKINDSDYFDVPYVINYIPDSMQLVMLALSTYMLGKEIVENTEKLAVAVSDAVSQLANYPTGSIASMLLSVGRALVLIAYCTALTIYLIKLMDMIIQQVYGYVRYYRTMKVQTLLERGAQYLGLDFKSSIFDGEYKNLVFLPKKTMKGNYGRNNQHNPIDNLLPWQIHDNYGYPSAQSYGYTLMEIIELVMKIFNAKPQVIDGCLYIEPRINKPFWEKTIQVMPNIGVETLANGYNANELKANYLIRYELDEIDVNTYDNFKGTNYERLTESIIKNPNPNASLISGLEEIRIPCALASRKSQLTAVENALKSLVSIADTVFGIFGQNQHYADKIKERVGMMNLSTNSVNVPKLLICESNGNLKNNYRDLISAKTIYNKYHWITSFVYNDYQENQYLKYTGIEIPFGFNDFLQCIRNSWFDTTDGRRGKFDKIEWRFGSDYAIVDYRIRKVYTTNLKETFVEG